MEKKSKLEAFVAGAGKTAKGLLKNAAQAMDQNDDGKFDLGDVAAIAEGVGDSVKKGAQIAKENMDEQRRKMDLKLLQPIFPNTLDEADFHLPKLIRVAPRDKRHAESEVCQGSIGYTSDTKELYVVHIFRDSVENFGLTFFPDMDSEFYYVDPTDRDHYIALDEYFTYLKKVRVGELKRIAQDLGAKHFRVTYMEEQTAFSEKKIVGRFKAAGVGTAEVDHHKEEKKYSMVKIEAEMDFPGHEPVRPQLRYFQRDPSIQDLVTMRMDESSPLLHERYMIEMRLTSGIKVNDAAKIDSVLKDMKFAGNATVVSEAQNESRRYLEYEIDF